MRNAGFIVAAAAALLAFSGGVQAGPTLEAIQKRGALECGVSTGLPGFSIADPQGNWYGLDVDICRAIAAAVLGDAKKVKFTPRPGP
jgi:general L-amino acid transport system substrate-binding protein